MSFKKTALASLILLTISPLSLAGDHSKSVGSSLNNKVEVALSDVPDAVKNIIKSAYPKFTMQEAEKELKHGNTYFDIEGLDKNGNDLEFDMLLGKDGTWSIAEIQRDLSEKQTPEKVVQLFRQHANNVDIARIIESDQGDGVIIYEFYTVKDKKEKKYEVKVEYTFLEKEWQH